MLTPSTPNEVNLAHIERIFQRSGHQVQSITRPFRPQGYAATTSASAHPITRAAYDSTEQEAGLADLLELQTEPKADVERLCREVSENQDVEAAMPRFSRTRFQQPSPQYYLHQWGAWRLDCEDAWQLQTGNSDVVVAVIDSGADPNHPSLEPNLLPGADHVSNQVLGALPPGWRFDPYPPVRVGNNAYDDDGHGTHVAGVIGARGDMNRSVAGIVWQCKILPVRCMAHAVEDTTGQDTSIGHPGDIANAIKWVADFRHNGEPVKVINLSLGGAGWFDPLTGEFIGDAAERAAIEYAQNKGCLIVAAVGNEGTRWPSFPASFPNVIGVGAVGLEDDLAPFSNWDKRSIQPAESVDVVAPGVNILSTMPGGKFGFMNGTSQATPHVTGLAAMLFSHNSTTTAYEVEQAIYRSAKPLGGPAGWHPYFGHGRINARDALALI